jgi:hypothetical protein
MDSAVRVAPGLQCFGLLRMTSPLAFKQIPVYPNRLKIARII